MTNRLEINWKLDGFASEQRYYRSESPMDVNSMPSPHEILSGSARSHIDQSGELGKNYYVRIGAFKNGVEKLSDEKGVFFGKRWSPLNLTNVSKIWLDRDNLIKDSSNRISQLTNMSDNTLNFVQAINNRKPVNVDKLIRFDGIDDFMNNTTQKSAVFAKNTAKIWVFAIVKKTASENSGGIFYAPTPIGASRFNLNFTASGVAQLSTRRLDEDPTDSMLASSGGNDFQLVFAYVDYQVGIKGIHLNGKLSAQKSTSVGMTSNTDGNNSSLAIATATSDPNGGNNLNADLLALIASSGSLPTLSEIDKLFGWAAHKYDLTDNLPADHPYKTLVPTI